MLQFTGFELHALLSNLKMMDTIFGIVPVREKLVDKIGNFLYENDLLSYDDIVDVDVE